ncbi:MAG: lysylphosphatidylglycerol synthase transmembrane domain-containing protein [archaeon]
MKLIRLFLPVGLILLAYIVWSIGPAQLMATVLASKVEYILYALCLSIPAILVMTYKWNFLLKKQGISVSFWHLAQIQLIGLFYGNISPAKLGSLVKIPYLQKATGKTMPECSSSVIIDRLLDLIALCSFGTIGLLLLINYFAGFLYLVIFLFLGLVTGFFILMEQRYSKPILRVFYHHFVPASYKEMAKASFESFYKNLPKISDVLPVFLLSLLYYVTVYTQGYIVAHAFSIELPYLFFITATPIASLVGLIPITIAGFGTREATLVFIYSIYAIPPAATVSFSIVSYFTLAIFPALVGVLFTFKLLGDKNE